MADTEFFFSNSLALFVDTELTEFHGTDFFGGARREWNIAPASIGAARMDASRKGRNAGQWLTRHYANESMAIARCGPSMGDRGGVIGGIEGFWETRNFFQIRWRSLFFGVMEN